MHDNLRLTSLFIVQTFVIMLLCGCMTSTENHKKSHWGYSGSTGPSYWGELSPDFILAKTGKQQSPIDIVNSKASKGKLIMRYMETPLNLVNNGHAIQLDYYKGSSLEADGNTYELKQFHIHSPSEHTIDGKRYDMEIHLVHQSKSGELTVIGLLLQQGSKNAFLEKFWGQLPAQAKERIHNDNISLNIKDTLPGNKSCYIYQGSLTTPPCSEGVKWYVFRNPAELSADQLAKFQKIYKGNFRPVQPLNGRTIQHCQ